MSEKFKTHTISLLLANKPGMLVRVALTFSRRAYNIDSLVVSPKSDESLSRMTITCTGCPTTLMDIVKNLYKLIDVLEVSTCDEEDVHQRELAFVKVQQDRKLNGKDIFTMVKELDATYVKADDDCLILQKTAESNEVDHFLDKIHPYGIVETVRSGKISMVKN